MRGACVAPFRHRVRKYQMKYGGGLQVQESGISRNIPNFDGVGVRIFGIVRAKFTGFGMILPCVGRFRRRGTCVGPVRHVRIVEIRGHSGDFQLEATGFAANPGHTGLFF